MCSGINYQHSKRSEKQAETLRQYEHFYDPDFFIEDVEEKIDEIELMNENLESQSKIKVKEKEQIRVEPALPFLDQTKKTLNNKAHSQKQLDRQRIQQIDSESATKGKIDMDMIYLILLILGVLVLLGLLLFSTGIWVKIAAIILFLILLTLFIVVVVVFAELFYFIFFGWWLG